MICKDVLDNIFIKINKVISTKQPELFHHHFRSQKKHHQSYDSIIQYWQCFRIRQLTCPLGHFFIACWRFDLPDCTSLYRKKSHRYPSAIPASKREEYCMMKGRRKSLYKKCRWHYYKRCQWKFSSGSKSKARI